MLFSGWHRIIGHRPRSERIGVYSSWQEGENVKEIGQDALLLFLSKLAMFHIYICVYVFYRLPSESHMNCPSRNIERCPQIHHRREGK